MKNVFRIALVIVLALGAVVAQTASDYTQVVEMLELSGHQGFVSSVVWSANSQNIVSGSQDATARVWDVATGRVTWEVKSHSKAVFYVGYTPDKKHLVTASQDAVFLWNLSDKKEFKSFKLIEISAVAVSPDSQNIAIAAYYKNDYSVLIFNISSGELRVRLQKDYDPDYISYSEAGDTLAISEKETLYLTDPETGIEFKKVSTKNGDIVKSFFISNGKAILVVYFSRYANSGIQIFEIPNGKTIREAKIVTEGSYTASAISPDEKILAVSVSNSIQLIEISTFKTLHTLKGHVAAIFDISFSPNGKFITSVSADKTIKVWGVPSGLQIFGQPSSNPSQTQNLALGNGKQVFGSSPAPSTPTAVVTPAPTPTVPASTSASNNVKPRDGVYALIIGIGKYKSSAVAPLEYAVSDAKRFAAALTKASAGGVNPANVTMLLDGDATKSAIEARVKRLAGGLKRGETLIVYFSGHGAPSAAGEALLVPWDADKDYLEDTAIGLSDLQARAAGAGRVVFILDSCFSGEGRSILAPGTRPFGVQVNLSAAPVSAAGGSVSVFSASRANETSNESTALQAGYFTFYLVQGLEGAADANKDGQVTLQEAQLYAQAKVSEAVKRERGSNQNPELRGDGGLVLGQNLELAASLGIVARVVKVKALADAGKLSGRQFLALKQLVDEKREPADLRDFLDGKLPEKDFLELVYQGFFESAGVPSGRP